MEVKLLSCPLCFKPHFEGVDSLRSTLVSVATSPLTCPVCCEVLIGLDKLTIHLFSHANPPEKTEDTKKSAQKEIDDSINSICNNGFDHSSTSTSTGGISNEPILTEEQVRDTNTIKENELVVCDICSFTFTDRNILDMHQKLLHQTTPDKKTGLYSYHCHLCSKKFKMRGSLMVHLRVAHYGFGHHNDVEKNISQADETVETAKESGTDDVKVLIKGHTQSKAGDNKQWECDVCSKMFTTKYFLKKHKRLHTGEMPYCCNLCNKSFTFQQSYHKHMLYHSSEKPYVCNECGRAFKELSTLQNHARIHSGERPYGCETCGKRFRQRVSYLVHRRIHTGDMPYKCTACEKSFRYKVSQRSHKCPMNPPGSVVRVPEQSPKSPKENTVGKISPVQSPNGVKCIMSVDYNTGNINFIPQEDFSTASLINSNVQVEKNCVRDGANNHTKADYNNAVADSVSVPVSTVDLSQIKGENLGEELSTKHLKFEEDPNNDIFSMVLSPILPEVESLCLNSNSPISNGPISPKLEENVQLMRDQSFDHLLFGPICNLRR